MSAQVGSGDVESKVVGSVVEKPSRGIWHTEGNFTEQSEYNFHKPTGLIVVIAKQPFCTSSTSNIEEIEIIVSFIIDF